MDIYVGLQQYHHLNQLNPTTKFFRVVGEYGDIECAFGILKGMFCILKYGLIFQHVKNCDILFRTLCALHNILLKEDGLDKKWMRVQQAQEEDIRHCNQMPAILLRLDSLFVEYSNSANAKNSESVPYEVPAWKRKLQRRSQSFTINNARVDRLMPQHLFVECLVEHFSILYERKEVVWPKKLRYKCQYKYTLL